MLVAPFISGVAGKLLIGWHINLISWHVVLRLGWLLVMIILAMEKQGELVHVLCLRWHVLFVASAVVRVEYGARTIPHSHRIVISDRAHSLSRRTQLSSQVKLSLT